MPTGLSKAIGIDLAYSTRTHADYSVAIVVGTDGERHYVLDVVRVQVEAPAFIAQLKMLQTEHGGAPIVWYHGGGGEKGTLDVMTMLGLEIDARQATVDKFTQCQPVAAAWNARKVLLPRSAPWLDTLVAELVSFTGIRDSHDDQVDALAAAFDAAASGSVMPAWIEDMRRWRENGGGGGPAVKPPEFEITMPPTRSMVRAVGKPPRFRASEVAIWSPSDSIPRFSDSATQNFKTAIAEYRAMHKL